MLHLGDCLEVMKSMPDNSVDLVLTDPPYGLALMGKKWDHDVPSVEVWAEALRVLKPGGHLLAFAGTRTQHRMACRIEDAGFEIRDMLAWVYGSGFPKSLDVSKAIDKAAGAVREVVGVSKRHGGGNKPFEGQGATGFATNLKPPITAPATDAAREWDGWGTALKPALEPITMARKPLIGTVAANVLEHGTGALNIDECRVAGTPRKWDVPRGGFFQNTKTPSQSIGVSDKGRWPANLLHDGSDEVVEMFPNASARYFYCAKASRRERNYGLDGTRTVKYNIDRQTIGDLPCLKVATALVQLLRKATFGSGINWSIGEFGESITGQFRSECLSTIKTKINEITESKILSLLTPSLISEFIADANCGMASGGSRAESAEYSNQSAQTFTGESLAELAHGVRLVVSPMLSQIKNEENWIAMTNFHATVKPIALMEYLVKLASREGQTVLDPFMGSGTTGIACRNLGRHFIGIEREPEYFKIAEARIDNATSLF